MDEQTSVSGPLPNSYWVTPGRFAAGGFPGAGASYLTATRFKALTEAGISCFINLTETGELPSYRRCGNGISRPGLDPGVPPLFHPRPEHPPRPAADEADSRRDRR